MKDRLPNMRRWTDAKLAKELAFAEAFAPAKSPEETAWLEAVRAEARRRQS